MLLFFNRTFALFFTVCGLFLSCCHAETRPIAEPQAEVLAIEYPPFTENKSVEKGIAFRILAQAYPNIRFKAVFVPPKRALQTMQQGDWCLSFYPAPKDLAANPLVLSRNEVVIGLIRNKQAEPFRWQRLSEFATKHVALLRTSADSLFAKQFVDAGLAVTFVETIEQGLGMLAHERVDLALFDNYNFSQLAPPSRAKFQFSETALLKTPITLYVNPLCRLQLQSPTHPVVF